MVQIKDSKRCMSRLLVKIHITIETVSEQNHFQHIMIHFQKGIMVIIKFVVPTNDIDQQRFLLVFGSEKELKRYTSVINFYLQLINLTI